MACLHLISSLEVTAYETTILYELIRIFEFTPFTSAITSHRLRSARGTARIQCKTHPLPPYKIAYYRPTRRGVTGVIGGLMTQGRQRSLSQTGTRGGDLKDATLILMSALQKS